MLGCQILLVVAVIGMDAKTHLFMFCRNQKLQVPVKVYVKIFSLHQLPRWQSKISNLCVNHLAWLKFIHVDMKFCKQTWCDQHNKIYIDTQAQDVEDIGEHWICNQCRCYSTFCLQIAEVCQMLSSWTKNSLHSINISDTVPSTILWNEMKWNGVHLL